MANTLVKNIISTLSGGPLADQLFGSAGNDPTLATANPAEVELRNKLNFANIRIGFPTTSRTSTIFTQANLSFPAYINSFTDSFSPSFAANAVYGRTDPIPTYAGTQRSISLSLTIPCFDSDDANENMKKINEFIKNIYPSYNSFKGDLIIASPPLVRVKFANLIIDHKMPFRGLLGYINNFTYSFDPKEGFYFDKSEEGTNNLFFRSYTIGFTMNVLHESVVGFKDGEFFGSNIDYPYRVKNSLLNPIQEKTTDKKKFGISFDLSEAEILK